MKLLDSYRRICGLSVGDSYLRADFFPLPFAKYCTLQTGAGFDSKKYSFWQEVIDLLHLPYPIVLLGAKDDPLISGTYDLRGQTSFNQSEYILKHAMLHIGNDSWLIHRSGEDKIPYVCIYGSTTDKNHGPYHYPSKYVVLESHRFGFKPSFATQEQPKTLDAIPPESIANAVLSLLNLPAINRQSLYIGPNYKQFILEVVPNTLLPANFYPDLPVTLRFDYHFNENALAATGRKMHIVTDKPVDVAKLQALRPNVLGVNYEVKLETDLEYLKKLRYSGIKTLFFSREKDEKKLADIRFKFFDVGIVEKFTETTREDFEKGVKTYLNKTLDNLPELGTLKYRSNKFLFSDGKVYLSKADWKAGKTVEMNNPVSTPIDNADFFEELNHFYIWKE